jgi:hypothetical protein
MTNKRSFLNGSQVTLQVKSCLQKLWRFMCSAAAWGITGMLVQIQAEQLDVPKVQTATNADGSLVRIVTQVAKRGALQTTDVLYSPSIGMPMKKIGQVVQPTSEGKRALVFLTDWAKDGTHAIEAVDECGAGPNCSATMYRIDAKQQKLIAFFKINGAEVCRIGGYLIEKSRDSCCAWVADAFKLNRGRTQVAVSPAFSVEISYDDERNTLNPVICTFYKETTKGRLIIDPPDKALLQICRHYGQPYSLSLPSKGN